MFSVAGESQTRATARILRELSSGHTYLAQHPASDRHVVLKRLPDDCLVGGQLHPGIRQRLTRVRELADRHVANLHGVERLRLSSGDEEPAAFLVWDHIEGETLAEACAGDTEAKDDSRDRVRRRLLRETLLAVESIHARGIVHGALHARNVLVDPETGHVTLTHVSPLLYDDVRNDEQAALLMVRELWPTDEAQRLVARAEAEPRPIAWLRARLVERSETGGGTAESSAGDSEASPPIRSRARRAALFAAVAGVAISVLIGWTVSRASRRDGAPAPAHESAPAPISAGDLTGKQ